MSFVPFAITGNFAFDYFYSIVTFFGMISVGPMILFKLFKW